MRLDSICKSWMTESGGAPYVTGRPRLEPDCGNTLRAVIFRPMDIPVRFVISSVLQRMHTKFIKADIIEMLYENKAFIDYYILVLS